MQNGGRAAVVVLGALALAAWLAWSWSGWSPLNRNELANLAAAVGSDLPFEARPTGGFAPSDLRTLRGADAPATVALSPDTRIAIAELENRAAADASPKALAAVGVAYLVAGDVDRAISTLEDAAPMGKTAAPWSDLSASYLVKAQRVPQRRIEYLSRALEAAATSIRIAPSNEALFNRALALDGLAPFVGQAAPWAEYMTVEHDRRWVEAAERHVAKDAPSDDARSRWDARQRELRVRLTKRDGAFVDETVTQFAEGSSEAFGQLILAWAKAKLANDIAGSRSAVEEATLLADSFGSVTGDRMSVDEMAIVRVGGARLAQAHLAYAEGVRAFNAGDYNKANDSLNRARLGFVQSHSTYVQWADVMLATIQFQQRELSAADRLLADVEAVAKARKHQTLLGRTLWLRGLVASKDWRLTDAFAAFRAAASCFEKAGEHEFAVSIYSLLADTLRTLGEHHESWENIGKTLEGLERLRRTQNRYLLLYNATLFASSQDLFEAALLFQHAAVREAAKAPAGVSVEALTQRAVVYQRKGDSANAQHDLAEARKRLEEVPDGSIKARHKAEIDVLSARQDHTAPGDAAEVRLKSAIGFFQKAEPGRVPSLYLELARMRLRDRSFDHAEEALLEGITTLERQQSTLSDEALKISYFDESWALFQEMVALQRSARGESAKAFEYAERSRARSLLAAAGGNGAAQSLRDIQTALPPSTVLLYYATLPDRLLVWAITSATDQFDERQVKEADLARLVAQHRSAITERRENAAVNDRLYEILLRPVTGTLKANTTLVVVPDGSLQQLPFATLRDPATRRYVIEDRAVLSSPSASFFASARARLQNRTADVTSALLVGNPAAGASIANTGAAPLPGAEAEVVDVAKYYPRHTVLTGVDATKDRFVQSAPDYDVVHFGGHAFANAEFPLLSRLSFAADGTNSERPLFAHEISRLRFSRTQVVILAACSTATGMVSRGEGAISVARPFLGAGVPIVIASQWDVDDLATQQLFVQFHRALASSRDPVTALRTAQLSLLRSENAAFATPASWGAFLALGTTVQ